MSFASSPPHSPSSAASSPIYRRSSASATSRTVTVREDYLAELQVKARMWDEQQAERATSSPHTSDASAVITAKGQAVIDFQEARVAHVRALENFGASGRALKEAGLAVPADAATYAKARSEHVQCKAEEHIMWERMKVLKKRMHEMLLVDD